MEKQKKELTMLRYINSNDIKITPRTSTKNRDLQR
uniref:Uncharacterized protein n=1 Tax=Vitis vinifera TaxID=29760 RepID=A5C617_VITVI|nr:hypothetical protein VITISV_019428 [Vitis vinifera]